MESYLASVSLIYGVEVSCGVNVASWILNKTAENGNMILELFNAYHPYVRLLIGWLVG